jgi:hypothetical protein
MNLILARGYQRETDTTLAHLRLILGHHKICEGPMLRPPCTVVLCVNLLPIKKHSCQAGSNTWKFGCPHRGFSTVFRAAS